MELLQSVGRDNLVVFGGIVLRRTQSVESLWPIEMYGPALQSPSSSPLCTHDSRIHQVDAKLRDKISAILRMGLRGSFTPESLAPSAARRCTACRRSQRFVRRSSFAPAPPAALCRSKFCTALGLPSHVSRSLSNARQLYQQLNTTKGFIRCLASLADFLCGCHANMTEGAAEGLATAAVWIGEDQGRAVAFSRPAK